MAKFPPHGPTTASSGGIIHAVYLASRRGREGGLVGTSEAQSGKKGIVYSAPASLLYTGCVKSNLTNFSNTKPGKRQQPQTSPTLYIAPLSCGLSTSMSGLGARRMRPVQWREQVSAYSYAISLNSLYSPIISSFFPSYMMTPGIAAFSPSSLRRRRRPRPLWACVCVGPARTDPGKEGRTDGGHFCTYSYQRRAHSRREREQYNDAEPSHMRLWLGSPIYVNLLQFSRVGDLFDLHPCPRLTVDLGHSLLSLPPPAALLASLIHILQAELA